jgi:hypothetical protein
MNYGIVLQAILHLKYVYIRLISLIENIVCSNSFRLEYLHVLTIEVLYLYDLTKLLCLLNLKNVTQPVYFTWQYVIRYHDQCLSPCNVSYGTTTCAFHMAQRLIFRLQVLFGFWFFWFFFSMSSFKSRIRRKSQSFPKSLKKNTLSELGVEISTFVPCAYGTMTSAFHMAMCHTVPRPVPFTWQCVIRYHDQFILHGNVSYGTTTSIFLLAMYHTLLRPVLFIWQCLVPYGALSCCTGCGTVWHIAMWKALLVVPYDTLPCERH